MIIIINLINTILAPSKIFNEKTEIKMFLIRKNLGPGFEKIQVSKKPFKSAQTIYDWEGITDNLRQWIILQYSDIGKYLLPLKQ